MEVYNSYGGREKQRNLPCIIILGKLNTKENITNNVKIHGFIFY